MADQTPVIACFKWGQDYPCKYTNILYRALKDRMKSPFRFVCITDNTAGLADGIESMPLPDFKMDRADWNKGKWPKLSIFASDLFAAGTPVLMLDVDIFVADDLTPLIERVREMGGLHIMKEIPDTLPRLFPKTFGKPLWSNSSVVGFIAGDQDHIFAEFCDQTYDTLKPMRNDQNFIHHKAKDRQSWPHGWAQSFKKNYVWHFPVNLVRPIPKPDGYVIIFHGTPNPEDLVQRPFKRWGTAEKFGFFPVSWVKSYWESYADPNDE